MCPHAFLLAPVIRSFRKHEIPDGSSLFEHFRDLPGALRLADVREYVCSLGFPPDLLPFKTFQ